MTGNTSDPHSGAGAGAGVGAGAGSNAGAQAIARVRPALGARILRAIRHGFTGVWPVRRQFDARALAAIQGAIARSETRHGAEIRFAVEASLTPAECWAQLTPRERAWQIFAEQGVWNTEHNNGVLIYLLWADHAVEIVVDRDAHRRIPEEVWIQACDILRQALRANHGPQGVVAAIERVSQGLAQAYPATLPPNPNELSNAPILLR